MASSTTADGEVTTSTVQDPPCLSQGRFGLQSYSTGAVSLNVGLRPTSINDLQVTHVHLVFPAILELTDLYVYIEPTYFGV
ncbi:MAG: hypothetical protein ABSD67_25880 [Terracidiphilus sp.]